MEYYIRSSIFWTTMVVYLGVITAAVYMQAALGPATSPVNGAIVVVGSSLTLALLVPHFLITAAYLKPEFITRKLIRRIDNRYLRVAARDGHPRPSTDRLLPIVEILERAIDRGDLTTARGGLEQIRLSYENIAYALDSALVDDYYVDGMIRIGRKAVSQSDEHQAAVLCVNAIGWLGSMRSPSVAIDALQELGFSALRRDDEIEVDEMVDAMNLVLTANDQPDIQAAVMEIQAELSRRLVSASRQRLLRKLIARISERAARALNLGLTDVTKQLVQLLEEIGHDSALPNMGTAVADVGRALQELGSQAPVPTNKLQDPS
jgi:hypothetical protein